MLALHSVVAAVALRVGVGVAVGLPCFAGPAWCWAEQDNNSGIHQPRQQGEYVQGRSYVQLPCCMGV